MNNNSVLQLISGILLVGGLGILGSFWAYQQLMVSPADTIIAPTYPWVQQEIGECLGAEGKALVYHDSNGPYAVGCDYVRD